MCRSCGSSRTSFQVFPFRSTSPRRRRASTRSCVPSSADWGITTCAPTSRSYPPRSSNSGSRIRRPNNESGDDGRRHSPPRASAGLSPKARLQSRSQGHREAVPGPGAGGGLHRDGPLVAHAVSPGLARDPDSRPRDAVAQRGRGRRDHAGVLPRLDDDARHDHGVLHPDDGAVRGVRELLPAHSGGRGGHGVPAHQHDVLLGHAGGLSRAHQRVRGGGRTTPVGVDGLRATQCRREGRRSGPRRRSDVVGGVHYPVLRGATARSPEFHHDDARSADERDVARSDAVLHVGMVHHVGHRAHRVRGLDDRLHPHAGGSPLLWQHLFWFFGHPEVYIAILPGFGIISHILPVFARKPLLGPRVLIACLVSIAFLSYTVWGHHMFLSGMNPFSATLFSVPTLIITIPATIVTLLWIGTIYGAKLRFTTPALFCLGFVSVFVSGGISGFFLAQPSIDTYLHGTYFVVGHFHFVMGVAAMFGIFAATYFWAPKMFGRMMNETLGKWHFWLTFIGVYCVFMPMHYLGLAGNVRRYSAFT